nr:hypothetical protein [Tanacetum cinerariifolium]
EPEQAPPLPGYVLGPEHANDENVTEDQPYAEDASPTAQAPKYDDEDDDMDIEADEEEEHSASAEFVVVALPAAEQAPSVEETESFETYESAATPPPHLVYCMIARISIPTLVPVPDWSDSENRLGITLDPGYEVGERSSAAPAARPAGEARLSREAWVRSMDASDLARGEVMSLCNTGSILA